MPFLYFVKDNFITLVTNLLPTHNGFKMLPEFEYVLRFLRNLTFKKCHVYFEAHSISCYMHTYNINTLGKVLIMCITILSGYVFLGISPIVIGFLRSRPCEIYSMVLTNQVRTRIPTSLKKCYFRNWKFFIVHGIKIYVSIQL